MARTKTVNPPEVGDEAPEFVLPAAQGGQLHLSRRIVHGPVIVVFYRGVWSEECVEYFKALSGKEREINVAGGTVVGIGAVEPDEAREFVKKSGIGSYVLYDYIRVTTRAYGLLEKNSEHGDSARVAVFLVDKEGTVRHAWLDERPSPDDLLAKVSEITGLPKEPDEDEEAEEKPKKRPRKTARADEAETEGESESESADKGSAEKGSAKAAARTEAGEESPSSNAPPEPAKEKKAAGQSETGGESSSEVESPKESAGSEEKTSGSKNEGESSGDEPKQKADAAPEVGSGGEAER